MTEGKEVDFAQVKRRKGGMSVAEAGSKGGSATAEKRGSEWFATIGRKGGKRLQQRKRSKSQ